MSVNAYLAQGVNAGAGMLDAARTKYNIRRDEEIRSRNAYVQDRAFNAQQDRRNAALRGQQEAAEAEHERLVMENVMGAESEDQARALYKWGREDAVRRGFDVSGAPEELPPGLWAKGSKTKIGNVTPSNYTPESLAQFSETGNFNDLVRYEPSRTTLIGGVPHAFDPVTSKFYPAEVTQPPTAENPSETRTPVTADTVAASEAEIEAAKVKSRKEAEQAALDALRKKKESVTGEQLKDVFAKLDPNAVRGRYGFVGGAAGAWGQDQKNAELLINRITKLLAVNEREKLKGQGTITDNETKMLEDALSVLSDWQAGDDLAVGELERIAGMFGIEWSGAQSGRGGKAEKIGGATVTFHDDQG